MVLGEGRRVRQRVAYGGLATASSDNLTKGRQVAISGRLEYREWTGQDGSAHSVHEVVADFVEFLAQANGAGSAPAPDAEPGDEPS